MTTNTGSGHVVAGVDTHKLTHHGAVLDADTGKLLSEREFPATWRATGDCCRGCAPTARCSRQAWRAPGPMGLACNGFCRLTT